MKKLFWLTVVIFMIALLALAPLAIIWALNTLFPILAINYGFFQWLAVVVLNLTWLSKYDVKTGN